MVLNESELADVQTQSRKRNKSSSYVVRTIEEEKDTNVTSIMYEDCHTKTEDKGCSRLFQII